MSGGTCESCGALLDDDEIAAGADLCDVCACADMDHRRQETALSAARRRTAVARWLADGLAKTLARNERIEGDRWSRYVSWRRKNAELNERVTKAEARLVDLEAACRAKDVALLEAREWKCYPDAVAEQIDAALAAGEYERGVQR